MAAHTTQADTVPLTDLEAAAHLPDSSSVRPHDSRPPSYMEQDMEEPLPTYMQAAKRRMKAVQQYPATKMPNRRARICLAIGLGLLCIIIVATSIAVTQVNVNSGNNNDSNPNGNNV